MSGSSMHVAKTGLTAQQTRMQVISNNLANVNTVGFKSDRVNFESLLYQITRLAGDPTSEGTALTSPLALGTGVRAVNTEKFFRQGSLISTDNALDIAIDGDGFFEVLRPDGTMGYTRNGTFSRNALGAVTTASGYILQPEINIPPGASNINTVGNLLDRIKLLTFSSLSLYTHSKFIANNLEPIGTKLCADTENQPHTDSGLPNIIPSLLLLLS